MTPVQGPEDRARELLARARSAALQEGCGEPVALSQMIAAEGASRLGNGRGALDLVCGLVLETPAWFDAASRGGIACTTTMPGRGIGRLPAVRVVALGFPDTARAWQRGVLSADVACVSVNARGSLGLTWGYTPEMVDGVRASGGSVLVQRNRLLPDVAGAPVIDLTGTTIVDVDTPPVEMAGRPPTAEETATARNCALLVGDGSCISVGIGTLGDTVLRELAKAGRRGLTFHSGMLGDGHADIAASGIVGRETPLGQPPFTTTTLLGTERLFRWATGDRRVLLRPTSDVHPPGVTSTIEGFCALNFALEVDLAGNAGAEGVGGAIVSGSGGQLDLALGACAAPGGRSIIGLPSVTRRGASRIVRSLSGPVTTPNSRVQFVVTEHGVAELWGKSAEERAKALVRIADPRHREGLTESIYA